VGLLAQTLATPVALVALPATALLVAAGSASRRALVVGVPAAALAVWWLLQPGDLPDQVMRAALVLTAAAFALASRRTSWTFTHRALLAVAVAALGISAAFLIFGWSWQRLHWWVGFRTGATLRLLLSAAMVASEPGAPDLGRPDFDEVLNDLVQTSADLFPAALALQLLVCLALAVVVVTRLAGVRIGRPFGRLPDYRFSEHLGWLLAASLVLLIVPGLDAARPVAVNVLAVMAVLYGLRGMAVVLSGLKAVRAGPILYGVAALAVFFVLPGTVLLGVLDAGLNLRRRRPPRSGA
jgi:hypothetical protein